MTPTTIPRVVGLDLSLTATGLAVVSGGSTPLTATLKSVPATDPSLVSRYHRLNNLTDQILYVVAPGQERPHLVVIEAPAFSSKTGQQHDRSGLWWLVVWRCHDLGLPVLEVPPTIRAKYGTGRGNAGKAEVIIAATRRYPEVNFTTDDEADALLLASIGMRLLGHPIEDGLPQTHLDSLTKLRLPAVSHA